MTLATFAMLGAMTALAQNITYQLPSGGWTYAYLGNSATAGSTLSGTTPVFNSLDGTWSRGNDSDAWDGSALGGTFATGNLPGGVEVGTDGGTSYLRIQDTGDPRNTTFAWNDPSNRKIFFGHDLSANGFSDLFLNTGVTLSFRARVPTSGTLDTLWTRNVTTPQAYPAGGDGYVTFGNGLGTIALENKPLGTTSANARGAIGFSLTTAAEYPGGPGHPGGSGLLMNELNGNTIINTVDTGEGVTGNLFPIPDVTIFHEFWITIQSGGLGTHQVSVYMDGSTAPTVFDVTAGNDNSYGTAAVNYMMSWLGIGQGLTGAPTTGSGAVDIDFVAVKEGLYSPVAVPEPSVAGLAALGLLALAVRSRRTRTC